MERFWVGDLGERYWAMVRSGIQKEPLLQRDELKKNLATSKLQPSQGGGFNVTAKATVITKADREREAKKAEVAAKYNFLKN